MDDDSRNWPPQRIIAALGDYDAVPAMLWGNWPDAETWAEVVRGLASIDKYWRLRWRLREANCSFQLIQGDVTDHPTLRHLKGTAADRLCGTVHHRTAFVSLPRLFQSWSVNVIAHERGHLINALLGLPGRKDVEEAHADFVRRGILTGESAGSASEWLAEDHARDCLGFPRHPEVVAHVDGLLAEVM